MSSKQVQVEARTLPGVHIGQRLFAPDDRAGTVYGVVHGPSYVIVTFVSSEAANLAPTDLVTLTGGGAG